MLDSKYQVITQLKKFNYLKKIQDKYLYVNSDIACNHSTKKFKLLDKVGDKYLYSNTKVSIHEV